MAATPALIEPTIDMDKLSYEIFSILESKFLFGYNDSKLFLATSPSERRPAKTPRGRVRILSIDAGGPASDGLLAGATLARLEASIRKRSGDPSSRIADFFDVAAGSGAGGVLAAMLFTRGPDGRPLFSAAEALRFLAKNGAAFAAPKKGLLRGVFREPGGIFRRIFADATLRDTAKPVLIPCYDLATGAPFLFSRADAVETGGYDFRMRDVCAATCADPTAAVEMKSVDGRTRIVAVGGGVATRNPTAAAVTHVLNNKQEFPYAAGVEDLLVVSMGSGEVASAGGNGGAAELVRIAGEGAADMVDQAVAMAFGHYRESNYVRIQAHGFISGRHHKSKATETMNVRRLLGAAEEMLAQRYVESVLFRGKKASEQTNHEKLEWLAGELVKEHEKRKKSSFPIVVLKPVVAPRTSSTRTSTVTNAASMRISMFSSC